MADEIDLTQGVYRRVYSGFKMGRRINAVSMEAEAWFWRLLVSADDYGNFPADPVVMSLEVGGRRQIKPERAKSLTDELAAMNLVRLYTVSGDRYGTIVNWEKTQPAPRNGRRIRRVPENPQIPPDSPGFPEIPPDCRLSPKVPHHGNGIGDGDGGVRGVGEGRTEPEPIALPAGLEPCRSDIEAWIDYKRERGERYKPRGLAALLSKLEAWGPEKVKASIASSMSSNYAGLFEPKGASNGKSDWRDRKVASEFKEQLEVPITYGSSGAKGTVSVGTPLRIAGQVP